MGTKFKKTIQTLSVSASSNLLGCNRHKAQYNNDLRCRAELQQHSEIDSVTSVFHDKDDRLRHLIEISNPINFDDKESVEVSYKTSCRLLN